MVSRHPPEKVSVGRMILLILTTLAVISALVRLFLGLGATTNLSDAYPWGLWISFDVLTGVALAGGGFTMAAIIYVFNLKKFEPLLRPAKISAFIGYLMFIIGLFLDLGLPWRIWHPMVMWNPHSVLFEVSWCVMLYTTVLGIDVLIMALERFQKDEWVQFLRNIYVVFIVAGIMLSTLHQSSLGALYLLMPEKMSELWATNAIGPLFFVSAVIGGLSIVTLESIMSAWAYGRKVELDLLAGLSKGLGDGPARLFCHEGYRPLCPAGYRLAVGLDPLLVLRGTVRHRGPAGPARHLPGDPGKSARALMDRRPVGLWGAAEPLQCQPHLLRRLPASILFPFSF